MGDTGNNEGSTDFGDPEGKKKNLNAQEYNCIKHALPKSKIPRVLLHENVNQARNLRRELGMLKYRRDKAKFMQEQNIRTFIKEQKRKQTKWRREDEVTIAGFNFPWVNDVPKTRPESMTKLYTSPRYSANEKKSQVHHVPLLPIVDLKRSKTEIVYHQQQTFCTKLPTVVETDPKLMQRYDKYRGKSLLNNETAVNDKRFLNLTDSLSHAKLDIEVKKEARPSTMSFPTREGMNRNITNPYFTQKAHTTL